MNLSTGELRDVLLDFPPVLQQGPMIAVKLPAVPPFKSTKNKAKETFSTHKI